VEVSTSVSEACPVDDLLAPNPPSGGSSSNDDVQAKLGNSIKPKKIITCKSSSYIGTFNARTLREDHKRLELAHCFIKSGLLALGIQEHSIVHSDELNFQKINNNTHLITTSATRNSTGRAVGGVGFILTNTAYESISLIKPISPRILLISFNGNPRLTLITTYSPTEGAPDEEAESFHADLRAAIHDVPQHHLLLVVGDLNAHLGKNDVSDKRWYWHRNTNRNGRLLRDTATECELEITNTRFQKKPSKRWTFLSNCTMTKTQLDFVLVRKKWRNSVKDTLPVQTFGSLGSDHRAVISKIKLSLRKQKREPTITKYNYGPLKTDSDLQDRYAVEVRNKFDTLLNEVEEPTVTTRYESLTLAIKATNSKLLQPIKKQRGMCPSNEPVVTSSRDALQAAQREYELDPNMGNSHEVAVKKQHLSKCYADIFEKRASALVDKAEKAHNENRSREGWKLINELTGRKPGSHGRIEGGCAEARLQNWSNHFQRLLGQPPVVTDEDMEIDKISDELNIRTDCFDETELLAAKKNISEGKAFGDDQIAPEILKRVDIDDIMLQFCNDALTLQEIPDQWKNINIVPVPKKGNLSKPDNYRGIALTSIVTKTLNRMILNRIKPFVEPLLRDNQNGFRTGRSTTSHILALRRIIEEANNRKLAAVLLFVDFKKAFDSIHRGLLMKILLAYGIPPTIVKLIENLYDGTIAKIITEDGFTEAFLILAGVMQGDTLAPYLFIIVIDYVMTVCLKDKDWGFTLKPRRSRRYPAEKFTDADFADDLALTTDTVNQAQDFLLALEEASNSVGLHLNSSKTKYIAINENTNVNITSRDGSSLDKVEDFIYLGAKLKSPSSDIERRKALAWVACHKLKSIWKSKMSNKIKIRIFRATVESVLTYGAETWSLNKTLSKRLDGCYTRLLRMATNTNWRDKIPNRTLYGDLPRLTTNIQERRLKLAGHIARHKDLSANQVLLWKPAHVKLPRGRPKTTYTDVLLKDTDTESIKELESLMLDRCIWRSSINNRYKEPP